MVIASEEPDDQAGWACFGTGPVHMPRRYVLKGLMPPNCANQTIWAGDYLPIMRGMNSESVDLICLDRLCDSKADCLRGGLVSHLLNRFSQGCSLGKGFGCC